MRDVYRKERRIGRGILKATSVVALGATILFSGLSLKVEGPAIIQQARAERKHPGPKMPVRDILRSLKSAQKRKDSDSEYRMFVALGEAIERNPADPELKAAIPLLAEPLMRNPSYMPWNFWQMRRWCAKSLGNIGKKAVPALLRVMKKRNGWSERSMAAKALERIGLDNLKLEDRVLCLCTKPFNMYPSKDELKDIVAMGKPAVPGLIKALGDDLGKVSFFASEALVKIGVDTAQERKIARLLRSRRWSQRAGANVALGMMGKKRYVPHLIRALNDGNKDVREAAAYGLGFTKDLKAVPALTRALGRRGHSDIWEMRMFAGDSIVDILAANPGNMRLVNKAILAFVRRAVDGDTYFKEGSDAKADALIKSNAGNPELLKVLPALSALRDRLGRDNKDRERDEVQGYIRKIMEASRAPLKKSG